MNQLAPQSITISAETPLTVTLPAQQWQILVNLLGDSGPYKHVAPLINEVMRQTSEQAQRGQVADLPPLNGMSTE